jgi:protein tyrosine/serine phosphatase
MSTVQPQQSLSSLLEVPIQDVLPPDALKLVLSTPPFIPIPHAINLRTISAPPLLPPNIFFRSGSLSHLPAPVLANLASTYNIKTIFDLRSRKEREMGPNPSVEGVEAVWIPSTTDIDGVGVPTLDGEAKRKKGRTVLTDVKIVDFVDKGGETAYVLMYGNVLKTHCNAYKVFFERLRDGGEGGILFHCTAGKDRTGVLAAMILALADAPDEVIAQDYAMTRIGMEPFREHLLGVLLKQVGKSEVEAYEEPGFAEMCGVKGQTILAFLQWMNREWGTAEGKADTTHGNGRYSGVSGYLIEELDFTVDDLEKIRGNLGQKSA